MKDIKDYEGLYKITEEGQVFSTPTDGKPSRWLKQEVIKRNHTSYRRVSLSKNGIVRRFQVHRLVAQAYIPSAKGKEQVNHKDSNGENNQVSNLEWVTGSENMRHSMAAGRSENMKINSTVQRMSKARAKMDAMINSKHGKLLVLSVITYGHRGTFECICDCGNKAIKRKDHLFHNQCRECSYKIRKKI